MRRTRGSYSLVSDSRWDGWTRSLGAPPVPLGLQRAGAGLCGFVQRLRSALPPSRQLQQEQAIGAAARALGHLVDHGDALHRIEPGRRCPSPLASGPGQLFAAPALQRARPDGNFTRHVFEPRALRRQQPRHRSAVECLSASCKVAFSFLPPVPRFYRSDRFSDAGVIRPRVGCLQSWPDYTEWISRSPRHQRKRRRAPGEMDVVRAAMSVCPPRAAVILGKHSASLFERACHDRSP